MLSVSPWNGNSNTEYTVLSETTILDPRYKKLAFHDKGAIDETLQRIAAAAARSSQTTPLPESQQRKRNHYKRQLFSRSPFFRELQIH